MTEYFPLIMGAALFVLMIPVVYRIWVGPTGFDRILGVNVIGTKTAVLLVIIGTVYDRVDMFVDFAIAYALLNFVSAIVVSRYLNRTISLKEMEAKEKRPRHEFESHAIRVGKCIRRRGGRFAFAMVGRFLRLPGPSFFLGTAVGMLRFPDFYTRMHAASKRGYLVHHAHVDWFRSFHDG